MKRFNYKSAAVLLLGLSSASALANNLNTPLSFTSDNVSAQISEHKMDFLDNDALRRRDATLRMQSLSSSHLDAPLFQFAEAQLTSIKPTNQWESVTQSLNNTSTDILIWRTRIVSEGALSLNLGFSQFHMPEGGALHIYSSDRLERIRAFTAADNDVHGQLWTPMIKGDEIILEVNIPSDRLSELKLEVASVNHGYMGENMGDVMRTFEAMSGSCNVDVACPNGDGWRDQIRSVAAMSRSGTMLCTGSAINNTANDGTPYFLTADHCGITSGNAASLVTYWNYENSTCRTPGSSSSGSAGDGTLSQFNSGAIFRASYSASDMTLLELDDPFDPAHNVYLAGWNASTTLATSAVAIHHPAVEEKRISFENAPVTVTSYLNNSSPGNGTHLRVADWDLGTTEGGSSGSPLFDQNKRIVGQLHGGYAACGNDSSDWYGWLNVSWSGGNTNSTRLSNWLDPLNTGATTLDGMNANGGGTGNQRPSANANGPYSAQLGDAIQFSSTGSSDSDGTIASFAWNFGDGNTSNNANPSHTYSAAGEYTAQLTVTDNEGASSSTSATVFITTETGGGMQSGIPITGISGSKNTEFQYFIDIPVGAKNLTFDTSGGSGDLDLYVRFGSEPTQNDYDCRPFSGSGTENCTFASPEAGRYYVMLRAYAAISNYQLVAKFETSTGGTSSFEDSGVSLGNKQWQYYTLEVTSGMSSIDVTMTGSNGDADLYIRKGSNPTTSNFECRSYSSTSNETCSINNPSTGTWHVGVYAYSSFSNLSIQGEAK